jgi:hypothetical protein
MICLVFRRQAFCFAFRLPDPPPLGPWRFEAAYFRAFEEIVNCFFSFSIRFFRQLRRKRRAL